MATPLPVQLQSHLPAQAPYVGQYDAQLAGADCPQLLSVAVHTAHKGSLHTRAGKAHLRCLNQLQCAKQPCSSTHLTQPELLLQPQAHSTDGSRACRLV